MHMTFDFDVFKDNLFALNQVATSESVLFSFNSNSYLLLLKTVKAVSSAYRLIFEEDIAFGRSLT